VPSRNATPSATFQVPLDVETFHGEVVVTGPGAVSFALSPEAARRTAERLAAAARALEDLEGQPISDRSAREPLGPNYPTAASQDTVSEE